MLALVTGRKRLRDGIQGELAGVPARGSRKALEALGNEIPCRVLGVEQSNTSVVYNNEFFLKLYRKVEEGENPDIELTRFLTEKAGFANVPPYAGQIEYRSAMPGQPVQVLALLQSWVASEGDAWTLTIDAATRYFERVLAARAAPAEPPPTASPRLLENDYLTASPAIQEVIGGIYPSRAELLGRRTGEMHLALSGPAAAEDPALAPEPFTMLYQRSLLQSIGTLNRRVFTSLKRKLPNLPADLQGDATRLLDSQKTVTAVLERALQGRVVRDEDAHSRRLPSGPGALYRQGFRDHRFRGRTGPVHRRAQTKTIPVGGRGRHVAVFPLRDFQRAAEKVAALPEDAVLLRPWAELWYAYVAGSFLRAYRETTAGAKFAPSESADFEKLLQAFLLEKAIYEVGYELNNRPDWIAIPIRGIFQVIGKTE